MGKGSMLMFLGFLLGTVGIWLFHIMLASVGAEIDFLLVSSMMLVLVALIALSRVKLVVNVSGNKKKEVD